MTDHQQRRCNLQAGGNTERKRVIGFDISQPAEDGRRESEDSLIDRGEERYDFGRVCGGELLLHDERRQRGVYCRPVCPVRPARACNVEFFPSAAAAEMSGYRPCLRCRPEAAPFSPAWKGSRTTANRAMRLIADGALDARGVEALAARLGIGPRHLSRLFQRHFGASPMQAAKTARIQRAKRLIDATDLPMTEIALRAGFRSLRRFNAVFAETYRRPPSEIRRTR